MNRTEKIGIAILGLIAIIGSLILFIHPNEEKITYVSSTEYIAGDEGQTIIRVTNAQGQPLSTTCYDTILYPNKTAFIVNQVMSLNVISNYYDTFTVPNVPGVYESLVECTFTGRNVTNSKTFHVSLLYSQLQANFNALNASLNGVIQSLSNVPEGVWNYTNRTLSGTQTVNIDYDLASAYIWNYTTRDLSNYTKIGDAVWYWNGVISPSLLGNMSYDVWHYNARYVHGEII